MTNATLEQMQEIERAADEVLAGYQHQIRELQDQAARDLKQLGRAYDEEKQQLLIELKEQSEKGKTILLSSHILSEVEAVTDDVVFIHKGKIIANGELKKIMKDAASLEEVFFNLIQEGGKEDEVIL